MKNYNNLLLETKEGILTLIISRPSSLNALNLETMKELDEVFDEILTDEQVKGVILTGAGEKSFVAGADITELANLDAKSAKSFVQNGHRILAKIENCPKPVIAAINGYALGGGCEIAMACHMRTATNTAIFGQPEVNLGVIPGYGGTQRLTRLIGKGKAIEFMTTGDSIKADEALSLGLVNHIFNSQSELMDGTIQLMRKILSKAGVAISMVLDSVNSYYDSRNGFENEAANFSRSVDTMDFKEGTRSFLEKRKPQFKGK
ncbi:MAG TPA: enoyl-CoA hydratase-related protein [Cyclobacteriaceae bacterium]